MNCSNRKIAFRSVDIENDIWCEVVYLFDTDEDVLAFFVPDNQALRDEFADGKKLKDFKVHHAGADITAPVTVVEFRTKESGKVKMVAMAGGYVITKD